jgi:hypothetical protein
MVEYESGVKLSFDFSLFAPNAGPQSRRMVLIGSEGVMEPEPEKGRVAIRSRGGAVRYVDVADDTPKEATANAVGSAQDPETYQQYLKFAQSLRTGVPAVSPEMGKTTIKLVLLAEKSLRTHRIMNWSDLPA